MNDFFDKLGAAVKQAANSVSTQVSVAAEEQKLRECYQALGKLCYKCSKTGLDASGAEFDELYSRIDAGLKRIKQLQEQANVDPAPYADAEDFVDAD